MEKIKFYTIITLEYVGILLFLNFLSLVFPFLDVNGAASGTALMIALYTFNLLVYAHDRKTKKQS